MSYYETFCSPYIGGNKNHSFIHSFINCDMIWFYYNHENIVNKNHFVLYVHKIKNVGSSRQTTIAVYADKDRIYCGESQDCCRCINFQTSEMVLFNIWRPHKGFVLFIYDNRYIIWVKLWKSFTLFPRSVYSVKMSNGVYIVRFTLRWVWC